jgi:hypothetical protein
MSFGSCWSHLCSSLRKQKNPSDVSINIKLPKKKKKKKKLLEGLEIQERAVLMNDSQNQVSPSLVQ